MEQKLQYTPWVLLLLSVCSKAGTVGARTHGQWCQRELVDDTRSHGSRAPCRANPHRAPRSAAVACAACTHARRTPAGAACHLQPTNPVPTAPARARLGRVPRSGSAARACRTPQRAPVPPHGRTPQQPHCTYTRLPGCGRLTAATPVSGPRSSLRSAAKAAVSVDDAPRDIPPCAAAAGTNAAYWCGRRGVPVSRAVLVRRPLSAFHSSARSPLSNRITNT